MEAVTNYWQQIGLNPKITVIEYNAYLGKNIVPCKTAGDVFLGAFSPRADVLAIAQMYLFPNAVQVLFEDEGSNAIYKNNPKATMEERLALVDKLTQYYYDNTGPIPILRCGDCYAWNPNKVSPWPHLEGFMPLYLEYVRHNPPLHTFRAFNPWPDR
jgi:ABC-type transport system substrate-binding protein